MYCKVSKGAIAYDAPFAKSKVPFARTIATFRERSFKPSVVVLYKDAFMGFSGDAHIRQPLHFFCVPGTLKVSSARLTCCNMLRIHIRQPLHFCCVPGTAGLPVRPRLPKPASFHESLQALRGNYLKWRNADIILLFTRKSDLNGPETCSWIGLRP